MRAASMTAWTSAALAALAARRLRDELAAARAEADGLRHERDAAHAAKDRARQALHTKTTHLDRVDRARRAERGFAADLREQLHRVHRAAGADGDRRGDDDVRTLVLRAAIGLVEAEKGLLLSRDDADRDGDLDLVAAEGFEGDPERSPVAQRFAREVLARDQIVRDDDPGEDDEIETLVAIPLFIQEEFDGVVVCANRPGGFADVDDDVLLALGDHAGSALLRDHLEGELAGSNRAMLRALAEALEARHPLRAHESAEVSLLARRIARRLGMDPREQEQIAGAALVRDVGYLGLPDNLLAFGGALEAEERAAVEMHPRVGHALLSKTPALQPVAEAVLGHHERWDGDGYPYGIEGEAIPRSARIVAVAEAFVAMTHERPFRPARTRRAAMDELGIGAGREWDPEVAAACVAELRDEPEGLDPGLVTDVASALDGDAPGRRDPTTTDPLTLLGGHRAFRDAAESAGREPGELTVAYVQLDALGAINRRAGYAAGDETLVAVGRAVARVGARHGGTAYRDSGRRFALLVPGEPGDLREQLHLELTDTTPVTTAVAAWRPGITVADLVLRVRRMLATEA